MVVHVERRVDANSEDGIVGGTRLGKLIKDLIGVSATVEVREPDTIARSSGKMRRVIDNRSR